MKKYILYTNPGKLGKFQISIPIQNLILRDYCSKINVNFSLPIEEYFFKNCYAELEGVLSNLSKVRGIIMCSYEMLQKKKNYLDYFFKKTKNLDIHFILEKTIIKNEKEYKEFLKKIEINKKIIDISKKIPSLELKKFK